MADKPGPGSEGSGDARAPETPPPVADEGIWPYLGVGCITTVSGFFGGGMIAVMIAKIVGVATSCTPEKDTGAPCNWYTYAVVGALTGLILFPTVAITLLRRGRLKQRNNV